jgi:TPR repeat protein
MYEDGLGVLQDLNIARFWYGKAAAQGNVQAQASLEGL